MAQAGLHLVYRSYAGENSKPRPSYYSKELALVSMLRAVAAQRRQGGRVEISFLNDGQIPAESVDTMARHGEVVPIVGGSARRSYRAALGWAAAQNWPGEDLVWFAEDDYLYAEDALVQLMDAAANVRGADYFSLWGHLALDTAAPCSAPRTRAREMSVDDQDAVEMSGIRWYRQMSTTSTFGARVATLHEDLRMLRVVPFSGGAWDHATCLSLQGYQPFGWQRVTELAGQVVTGNPDGDSRPLTAARSVMYTAVNLRSRRRRARRRRLYASDPQLAYHMELPDEARGDRSWAGVAHDCVAWATDNGLTLAPGQAMSGPPNHMPLM